MGQVGKYSNPDALVGTEWLFQHHRDAGVKVIEVDYDPASNYNISHIPGAILVDWKKDINDPINRDIVNSAQLGALLSRSGVSEKTMIVLYGDFSNWFAAFAFWVLKYYRIENVSLLNGGRKKWLLEDRPTTKDVPIVERTSFIAQSPDESIRVFKDHVIAASGKNTTALVDVRSPREFSGEVLAPPEYPTEHAQRGGHIPGALNIPWALAVKEADGTFQERGELEVLFSRKGVRPDKEVITYCRIGERSSHTWFVLKYLLGYPNVKNYDGSWTEWGNSIGLPIERSASG